MIDVTLLPAIRGHGAGADKGWFFMEQMMWRHLLEGKTGGSESAREGLKSFASRLAPTKIC
ncbi:hypothetical protein CJU81_01915 [Pseudomonas fragi]|uniref:Uncharacterized protein n=1 Tax=Pseudomonas fragi TaxID=296 RepID=A0A267AW74_PSEFR|nr:hypothetical protein CJU81_01915 [Pseudomonas fragi]